MSDLFLNIVDTPVERFKPQKRRNNNAGPFADGPFKKLKTDSDTKPKPFKKKVDPSWWSAPAQNQKKTADETASSASQPKSFQKKEEVKSGAGSRWRSAPQIQERKVNGVESNSSSVTQPQSFKKTEELKLSVGSKWWETPSNATVSKPIVFPTLKKVTKVGDNKEKSTVAIKKEIVAEEDSKPSSPQKLKKVDNKEDKSPNLLLHQTKSVNEDKKKTSSFNQKKMLNGNSNSVSTVKSEVEEETPSKWGVQKETTSPFRGKPRDKTPAYVAAFFKSVDEIPTLDHKDVNPVAEDVFSLKKIKDAPIHPHSIANLEKNMGMTKMTTVQQLSFPVIMSGKDCLVRSQTGSGKTIAYALPIVESLQGIRPKLQRSDGVHAVVIVPTRELALQTFECFVKLVKPFTWIVPGYLVGGEKKKSEKARLRKGITILIGTPGRLLDHIQTTKNLVLNQVKWLVIDEADRLLDMGYEKDVASFVRSLNEQQYGNPEGEKERFHPLDVDAPEIDPTLASSDTKVKRQTIMLSATLSSSVDRLAGLALKHPKFVDAAASHDDDSDRELIEKDLVIPDSLTQWYLLCPSKLRLVTLASLIVWKCRMSNEKKMLIFMATQDMVDFHTELFSSVLGTREKAKDTGDLDVDSDVEDEYGLLEKKDDEEADESDPSLIDIEFFKLHGNMAQKDRTDVFKSFRSATSGVLLCTDVAARGLDLPHVDWIVQYTAPGTSADYVHRVGRTARVGSAGSSLIMLAPSEAQFVTRLEEQRVKIKEQQLNTSLKHLVPTMTVTVPELNRMRKGKTEYAATKLQLRFEDSVKDREDLHGLATKAYISFVRFYASYPIDSRTVFNFKALHLGHYAKSFALRDPPSQIGGLGKKQWLDRDRKAPGGGGGGGGRDSGRDRGQRPRGGPGSSRGLAGGRGSGRAYDGKPGSGVPFSATNTSKPSAFNAKYQEKRTSVMAAAEFASGVEFKKKKKPRGE